MARNGGDASRLDVMSGGDEKAEFIAAIEASLTAGTFVRLTLGKFRGSGDVQKIVFTPVALKGHSHLKCVTSHARKDVTQNYSRDDGVARIGALVGEDFLSATLFTTSEDVTLSFTKKKVASLKHAKPTFSQAPSAEHNRTKQYIVDSARPYLKALGVTQDGGGVKPSMYPKFKQICRFVEIIDQLLQESEIREADRLTVTDIGAGKGYLTFALYDHLTTRMGKQALVTGIEARPDLVRLCNDLAVREGLTGLSFEAAAAEQSLKNRADVMIALHACDTATDDAIFQGIKANASLIVTAPCCQHELAPQLSESGGELEGLLKFGLFKQRHADLVTDAARCLLLEASGYRVKVIEFVSTEHTAKNILIAAIRDAKVDRSIARRQYDALKATAGFETQRLEKLLAELRP